LRLGEEYSFGKGPAFITKNSRIREAAVVLFSNLLLDVRCRIARERVRSASLDASGDFLTS